MKLNFEQKKVMVIYSDWTNKWVAPVWPDGQIGFSIFGHLQQWKIAQKLTNCPKVVAQLCQIPNKP